MTSLTGLDLISGGGTGDMATPGGNGQDGRMPVSEAVRRMCENPAFWTDTVDDESGELRISFPVLGGYALVLDVDLAAGGRTLGLRRPGFTEPDQLGWAPADGPYPAALRWWELDLCARVIAWEDPTLPHPGLVVALLSPFAPATADDDETAIAAVRESAYRSLRREVPPAEPAGPEQAPLPIFASEDWWPAPRGASPEVLDEAAVAALSRPARALLEVRAAERFPSDGLSDLVRRADAHLGTQSEQGWYVETKALSRKIVESGDLRLVSGLLAALTEAGCDHPTVLDALSEPLVAAEACWMVETLAGSAPGTLLRRHL
jgi:hypothetical protein